MAGARKAQKAELLAAGTRIGKYHLLQRLADRGVGCARLTLHVGAGTFLPVKVDELKDHAMHAEYGIVDADTAATIHAARKAGGRIVAVGTTSDRRLETAVG